MVKQYSGAKILVWDTVIQPLKWTTNASNGLSLLNYENTVIYVDGVSQDFIPIAFKCQFMLQSPVFVSSLKDCINKIA